MFMSAKVFFDDKTLHNTTLLIRAETAIPREYITKFKKNVVKLTPNKTGALRRSIITQSSPGKANIGWRSAYAQSQNVGRHTQHLPVSGPNTRDGGYGTIGGGRTYLYGRYTTPGTGPHFANKAYRQTNAEMPAVLRELGLTK